MPHQCDQLKQEEQNDTTKTKCKVKVVNSEPVLKIADFQDQELVLNIRNPSNISYNDYH